MKSDSDKKDTNRGLGKPPTPAKLDAKPEATETAEPSETDSRAKLFESDTIAVSAETQRQWSMAERPRAKKEELVETLPPNQTEVKPPEREGESATFPEDEVTPAEIEQTGPTEPPKARDAAKFEPERQAPSIDVSKAIGSFGGDRAQTTWVTPRTQKRRFRRAALGATVGALLVIGVIWFVATTGTPRDPSTSSSTPEAAATTAASAPVEPQYPDETPPVWPEGPSAKEGDAQEPEAADTAATPPPAAERSPVSQSAPPSQANVASKKPALPTPVPKKPAEPAPTSPKTPSTDPPSGKAEKAFDPTQPIYR